MLKRITEADLREGSSEIISALDRGESFVVTRDGVPVGELVPLRGRRFVRSDPLAATDGAEQIDWAQLRDDADDMPDEPAPRT